MHLRRRWKSPLQLSKKKKASEVACGNLAAKGFIRRYLSLFMNNQKLVRNSHNSPQGNEAEQLFQITIPSDLTRQLLGSSKQVWGKNTKCLQKFFSQRNGDYFREYILVFLIQFWKKKIKLYSMQFKVNPHAYVAASKLSSNFSPSLLSPSLPVPLFLSLPLFYLPFLFLLPFPFPNRITHLRAQYCWGGFSRLSGSIDNCSREELFSLKHINYI